MSEPLRLEPALVGIWLPELRPRTSLRPSIFRRHLLRKGGFQLEIGCPSRP